MIFPFPYCPKGALAMVVSFSVSDFGFKLLLTFFEPADALSILELISLLPLLFLSSLSLPLALVFSPCSPFLPSSSSEPVGVLELLFPCSSFPSLPLSPVGLLSDWLSPVGLLSDGLSPVGLSLSSLALEIIVSFSTTSASKFLKKYYIFITFLFFILKKDSSNELP